LFPQREHRSFDRNSSRVLWLPNLEAISQRFTQLRKSHAAQRAPRTFAGWLTARGQSRPTYHRNYALVRQALG
jgi:hypothetical protein